MAITYHIKKHLDLSFFYIGSFKYSIHTVRMITSYDLDGKWRPNPLIPKIVGGLVIVRYVPYNYSSLLQQPILF